MLTHMHNFRHVSCLRAVRTTWGFSILTSDHRIGALLVNQHVELAWVLSSHGIWGNFIPDSWCYFTEKSLFSLIAASTIRVVIKMILISKLTVHFIFALVYYLCVPIKASHATSVGAYIILTLRTSYNRAV